MNRNEIIYEISKKMQKSDNLFKGYSKGSISLKCLCDNLTLRVLRLMQELELVDIEELREEE